MSLQIPKSLAARIDSSKPVVTRFPPEPSGFLHIGHAKALFLNQFVADHYDGKMLVRFDDTNPQKEDLAYEKAILEDINRLEMRPASVTHTSDYFDRFLEHADRMIAEGNAYVDLSTAEEIANQRKGKGTASPYRDTSVEENQKRWEEMKQGKPGAILRMKMDPYHKNKNLRDPYAYRVITETPHHLTGKKYQVYPSYDFSCPLVDYFEGVTVVMRSAQYADRGDQYKWVMKFFRYPPPVLMTYGEVNFTGVDLSKRKMKKMVEDGVVNSLTDPRLPTIQGIMNRGMSVEGLKSFIASLGFSKNSIKMGWDKIWATNRKIIDKQATRVVGLVTPASLNIDASEGDEYAAEEIIPMVAQNVTLGTRLLLRGPQVLVEQGDKESLVEGEEITLLNWGNMKVLDGEKLVTHPSGKPKHTKKRLTWLRNDAWISVQRCDFDRMNVEMTPIFVDKCIEKLPKGSFLQLYRIGYYRLSRSVDGSIMLIQIPTGRETNLV